MSYELAKAYIQVVPTTKGIKGNLESELGGAGESAGKKAGSGFSGSFGNALKTVGKASAAALAAGVGAMTAFTKASVETGMNFDSSMSQVAATMGITMDELTSDIQTVDIAGKEWTGNLRDYAKKMGSETKFSATEAADALNFMALAGYDTQTSMQMLPNVLNLAAAGGMELATASDMVTDTQSALGLSLEETTAMVDQMAKASSKSNTSVSQLGDAFLKIGATARQVKGGTQELSTILGVLADNGIKGSEGGTHLRNILLSMQDAVDGNFVMFDKFGVRLYEANGEMRSITEVIKDMSVELNKMTDQERSAALSEVFNKTDLAAVNALIGTQAERYDELAEAIGNSAGAAQDMADTQLDNLAGDITIMQSAFEGLQIAVSDGATPAIRESVQGITEVINGLNDLVSGVDGGAARIEAGFSQIMQGVNSALPSIVSMFSSVMSAVLKMIPSLASSIVQMLPSLFDQILSAVSEMIPQIARVLPDLIQAVISLVVNLVSHLSEIITPIIQAIPSIIKSFITGLLQNLPTLIQGILDLVVGVVSALPEICSEIVEYIPELIAQLAKAIVECIPKILLAVGELVANVVKALLGIKDPFDEAKEKMKGLAETARTAWDDISEALNQEVDVSGLISSLGNTTSEIQTQIDGIEGKISEIIKTRLREQEGLRQEDIQNIKNYIQKIRELEEEKLSIYGSQAEAQLQIMKNMTGATAEEQMVQLGKLQAYDAQQLEELEKFHNTQYVDAQNQKNAMLAVAEQYIQEGGSKQDAEYSRLIEAANSTYEQLITEADTYYDKHVSQIESRESEALAVITGSNNDFVKDLNRTYQTAAAAGANYSKALTTESDNWRFAVYQAEGANKEAFASMIESMDDAKIQSTAAWLGMVADAKAQGTALSGDAKTTAGNILGAFKNMPAEMKGEGTNILQGLANGLKDQIPQLENASEMSAEEIVKTIENYLGIASPSRVMSEIGSNTIAGLVQGIQNTAGQAGQAMYNVGTALVDGIGTGMQARGSWLNLLASQIVTEAVNAAKAAGKIKSPSRVMRDEVGLMLAAGVGVGILDGEKTVTGAIDELSDSMWKASKGMEIQSGLTAGNAAFAGAMQTVGSAVSSGSMQVFAERGNAAGGGTTIYITNHIDGADNPEEFASRLVRQIKMEMRMA